MIDEIITLLEENKLKKEKGEVNSIEIPFERFGKFFYGYEKGKYFLYTANSGIGKTKITKFLAVLSVLRFAVKHNLKVHIKYFALEESSVDFWLSFLSAILDTKENLRLSVAQLKSLGEHTLTNEQLLAINRCKSILSLFMTYITVYDSISNGYGIFKEVKNYAKENGKFYYKGEEILTDSDQHDKYVANNPDEYVFVIVDHMGLLISEKNKDGDKMDERTAMGYFSKEYALKNFCKKYKYVFIGVVQQSQDQERMEFTNKGDSVIKKLEPTISGIANNKEIAREADFIFGLFAPDRYEIEKYRGYDITKLKDTYRCLIVLKDRWYGTANSYVHLFMDGVKNEFYELPKASDMSETKYREYLSKVNK